jgi:FkbM family methyltransferase
LNIRSIRTARRLALPLLAKFGNFDLTIRHHYTGHRVMLNAFKHKGYWYLGKNRERDVMLSFQRMIREGDVVVEVGGHIGYISLYFAKLVGPNGHVFVFEPGINNLPYTVKNLQNIANVSVIQKAVSDHAGRLPFYIEDLSGQNNSLLKDFWVFDGVAESASINGQYRQDYVDVVTLDEMTSERGIAPTFIKIDVEGAELNVLQGARETIRRYKPTLMLEVNLGHQAIYDLVRENGYHIYDDKLNQLEQPQPTGMPNIFCVHRDNIRRPRPAPR